MFNSYKDFWNCVFVMSHTYTEWIFILECYTFFIFFITTSKFLLRLNLQNFLYSILGQKIFSFLIFNELSQSLQQTSFLKMFVLLQTYICVYIFAVLISPSCLLYLGCIGNIADANRSFGIIKRRACLAFKITIDITEIDDEEIILL